MQVAYFGCWNEVGHGLYDMYGHTIVMNQLIGFPWSVSGEDIDGLLCPDNDQKEGEVKITHATGTEKPWTAMGWWDRSVDNRRGSNSVLFTRGQWDRDHMMLTLYTMFSHVFKRQNVPLIVFPPGLFDPEPS